MITWTCPKMISATCTCTCICISTFIKRPPLYKDLISLTHTYTCTCTYTVGVVHNIYMYPLHI